MICVSISGVDQLPELLEAGVTLLELRLDLIREDPEHIYQQIPDHVQTIATCRPEGYNQSERIELLKTCMDLGANFIVRNLDALPRAIPGNERSFCHTNHCLRALMIYDS